MSQQSQITPANYAAGLIVHTAFNSCTGAIGAGVFTVINPVGGAIFGAVSTLSQHLILQILNHAEYEENESAAKIINYAVSFFSSIAIGALVASAVGFPITFTGGVVLTACMMATSLAIILLFGYCATSVGRTATMIA